MVAPWPAEIKQELAHSARAQQNRRSADCATRRGNRYLLCLCQRIKLYELAVQRREGRIDINGVRIVETGQHTGQGTSKTLDHVRRHRQPELGKT